MENGKTKQFKPIGQLVDFQWRLGVAMKSHNCINLGTPYVSVLLKVADSDHRVTEYTFEMNLQEFQDFSKKITDISSLMEALS